MMTGLLQREAGLTPGPWTIRGCELVGCGTLLATCHWHSGRGRANLADKRAIAAVPDMVAALEIALDDIDREAMPVTYAVIENALKKAGVL